METKEFFERLKALGMTRMEFAHECGVRQGTPSDWAKRDSVPVWAQRIVELKEEVRRLSDANPVISKETKVLQDMEEQIAEMAEHLRGMSERLPPGNAADLYAREADYTEKKFEEWLADRLSPADREKAHAEYDSQKKLHSLAFKMRMGQDESK